MLTHWRHLKYGGCPLFLLSLLLSISLIAGLETPSVWGGSLSIENVRLSRNTLRPGEEVVISFMITAEAKVTVLLYSPDYEVVRRLMDGERRPAGTVSASWDGRDESGTMVPEEAFLVGILADGQQGEKAAYDPTVSSGGEALDVPVKRLTESSGQYEIVYALPAPSRISIRAGIHRGPMLKTILDGKPLPAGDHVQIWDGRDETGRIHIMKDPKKLIQVTGFYLPKNSIIVQGSGGDYASYHRNLKPAAAATPQETAPLSYQGVRKNLMQRLDRGISQQFLSRRSVNTAPRFSVRMGQEQTAGLAEQPLTTVSGQIGLTIEVAPESLASFNETRYEIIVFIDNLRFDEEEQAYSPYTYTLDTKRLPNGEHLVTINLFGITGQIGAYTFSLNVQN